MDFENFEFLFSVNRALKNDLWYWFAGDPFWWNSALYEIEIIFRGEVRDFLEYLDFKQREYHSSYFTWQQSFWFCFKWDDLSLISLDLDWKSLPKFTNFFGKNQNLLTIISHFYLFHNSKCFKKEGLEVDSIFQESKTFMCYSLKDRSLSLIDWTLLQWLGWFYSLETRLLEVFMFDRIFILKESLFRTDIEWTFTIFDWTYHFVS